MMSSMLDMDEVTIEAVMTHRGGVTMIDIAEEPEEAFKIIGESPYTKNTHLFGNTSIIL